MLLSGIDWLAIALFFVALFGIALVCSKRAGRDAKDFFLSGRSMPWWLIGVSMCAASTSTNSANMFTEFIRNSGLSENWKWWAFLLTGMLTVFVYSKLWVRSGAKSDIEFYELRYSGRAAAFLRGFRSLYLGIVFNVITTGLVMLAAIKIGQVLFGVDQWTVIAVTAVCSIVYSALGGFRGAIYTDFFLFIIIMVGAVVGMIYALDRPEVGGFAAMMQNPVVLKHLSFLPDANNTDLFVSVFVIPIAIQWWNVWYPGSEPGGGGYIVQRMLSAKSENHCVGGSVLYQIVNYAIRPWPWYLTAFASLIVFPDLASLQKAFPQVDPSLVKGDLAYPAMLTFVPNGWLGVVAASMMGALFSTVAAHLSMGSNYIANDFWKRFVRPGASERETIVVGRVTVIVLMVLSGLIAPLLSSAGAVFNLILQIGAGTGLIYLLRWFWMRINAWSEITAMAVSFVVAVSLKLFIPELRPWQQLLIVMGVTTVAWVGVTLLTPPTEAVKRASFQNRIRANGHDIAWGLLAMTVACICIYAMMFAFGYWIYGRTGIASAMTAIAVLSGIGLFPILHRLNDNQAIKQSQHRTIRTNMAYEKELTAAEVKSKAKECGADIVGIAPMSRWEGTDKQHDPRYIFPGAKSMIVMGFRIPRGSLRGVEEGTHYLNYATMGYAALNSIYGPMVLWELNRYMEDHGYEAVPMANVSGGEAVNPLTGNFRKGWSRPVKPGLPAPDVSVDFRVAAFLAGLGEFGYSRAFLTPQFGPRQRFAIMLTDAELEPDPIYTGHICDRCMECVKNCHGKCISPTETVKAKIGGVEVEWAKRDEMACSKAFREGGLNRELSPFDGNYPRKYGYGLAHEGSCGCIRACMVHLEERAKLTQGFRNPFRKPGWKQWEIDHSKPYELPEEIRKEYAGNIEAQDAYTNYNIKSNYGTKAAAGLVQDNSSSGGVA